MSSRLTELLAARLAVDPQHVRLYVKKVGFLEDSSASIEDELRLRQGFVAGLERSPGHWRVLEDRSTGVALFQRRALWEFAVGVALLLPVSWMFARALSAPIRRFSEAARRLGTDPYAPALERDGPAEMLAAIDSFNAMQGRVTRLLQERSQMVAAIAHDLRTPLTRLAFRLDGLDSPLKEKVESDIQQMTLMISAALDFVRDRSLGGTRERLDLRLLVESVVDDQSDVGHDVTLDGAESVPLQGDPVALRRAVANLVENAVKYGERARLHLRVSEGNCVIDIDDDGPGIPEALQERVFEPFFRAERSRNRDTGGIGLGLTTVRSIIVDHGGTVTLRNRKDGGLRVVVTLPVLSG
jgi:two-component system OmpR family sensor kinase